MTPFPISEKQFKSWLATAPKKRVVGDPLDEAVKELNPEVDYFGGDTDWCFGSDLAYGGNQYRIFPKWCLIVIKTVAKIGYGKTRLQIQETLNGKD